MGLAAFSQPSVAETTLYNALIAALTERMQRGEARAYDPEKVALLLLNLVDRAALTSLLAGDASMQLLEDTLIQFVQHALIPDKTEQ
jgi:hypothetical protein